MSAAISAILTRRSLLSIAAACVSAFAAATPALARPTPEDEQTVRLTPARTAGSTLRYTVSLGLRLSQSGADAPRGADGQEFVHEADLTLTFGPTAGEGAASGDTRVTIAVDRLRAVRRQGERMFEATLPQVTADVPADEPAAAFLAVQRAIKDASIVLTLDASGEITGIDGLSGAIDAAGKVPTGADAAGLDPSIIGMFDPESLRGTLQPIFTADDAAKAPRRKGDGWQTEDIIPLGVAGGVRITTDWSLASLDAGKATIEGKPVFTVLVPSARDASTPTLTISEQRAGVTAVWSLPTTGGGSGGSGAVMESRQARQTVRSVWTLGGETLDQKQDITATITRLTK